MAKGALTRSTEVTDSDGSREHDLSTDFDKEVHKLAKKNSALLSGLVEVGT